MLYFFKDRLVRVFMNAIRPGKDGKDSIQVNYWAEENTDAWVINQEHQGVRNAIIAVSIK